MTVTPEHKRRCLIRYVLAMTAAHGRAGVDKFLANVQRIHGDDYAASLRDECRAQWKLGNRGAWGDWR